MLYYNITGVYVWAFCRSPTERLLPVMPAKAGIQYSAAFRFNHRCLWNTGSPPSQGRRPSMGSRSRDGFRPRFAVYLAPQKVRGRREDRVRAAPAVSCAKRTEEYAHEHTGSAEASGLPCAMVYGLLRALPGERLSCHRRSTSCPVKLDASTAASEPHDFAVRDRPRSSVMATTSIASHRAFVTIASAPLAG
jgi:hypothetical protein